MYDEDRKIMKNGLADKNIFQNIFAEIFSTDYFQEEFLSTGSFRLTGF